MNKYIQFIKKLINYLKENIILLKIQIQNEEENYSKDELDYNIKKSKKEKKELNEGI